MAKRAHATKRPPVDLPFAPPNWPGPWEIRNVAELKPYPQNARTHSPAQITFLADLIKKFGPDQPIVVDENDVILKGHGRALASVEAGITQFPVVRRVGMSDVDKKAMRISDNAVSLMAGWDAQLIQGEIGGLKLAGYDIDLLGFPETQLRGWGIALGTDSAQDPEVVPELPKKPIVRIGDRWILGGHVLLCGDATSKSDVAMCLGDSKPNLMVVDPPYGVDYDPDWRNRADRANGKPYGGRAIGKVKNDDQSDWMEAWKLFPGDVAYCWHAGLHASSTQRALESAGFVMRAQIIWAKTRLIISRGDYHAQHEPCWYVVRKGKPGKWNGGRSQTTLWTINHQKSETGHSTQKPIECMKRPIENNSRKGEFVYDPFVGSGTTIIAAEMTGRKALAIEIDPGYCQVSIERWQTVTGQLATLDGRTLEHVAKARRTGRAKGEADAAGDPGIKIPRRNGSGDKAQRPVRAAVHAGRAPKERITKRVTPPVAGDS